MELSGSSKPLTPDLLGYIILCFSLLWFANDLRTWFNNQNNQNNKFPFEALSATLTAIGFVIALPGLKENDLLLSSVIFIIALVVLIVIMLKQRSVNDWKFWTVILVYIFLGMLIFWNHNENNLSGQKIKVMLETEKIGETQDEFSTSTWEDRTKNKFEKKSGVQVEIVPIKSDVISRRQQILDILEPSSQNNSENDEIDVFAIDVIWSRELAKYATNLQPDFKDILQKFHKIIIKNDTININNDSKLVAIPWYIDTGLLYYRKDLLKKYYHNEKPPETWIDLEKMAKNIQTKERESGNKSFWGFVWEGQASEELTCNALEWQFSHGGGKIVARNQNKNVVDIDLEATTKAFERAKKWVNPTQGQSAISPPEVLESDSKKAFEIWRNGNAAFMRNWIYAYNESFEENRLISENLRGKVGVTLLPKGDGQKTSHTSTLGGWQLMVNANSQGKKKKAAIEFVKFLLSKDIQESLAIEIGKLPSLKELYNDGNIVKKLSFLNENNNKELKEFFTNDNLLGLVERPSTLTGRNYSEISKIYFEGVHKILKGTSANTQEDVKALHDSIERSLKTWNS